MLIIQSNSWCYQQSDTSSENRHVWCDCCTTAYHGTDVKVLSRLQGVRFVSRRPHFGSFTGTVCPHIDTSYCGFCKSL